MKLHQRPRSMSSRGQPHRDQSASVGRLFTYLLRHNICKFKILRRKDLCLLWLLSAPDPTTVNKLFHRSKVKQ